MQGNGDNKILSEYSDDIKQAIINSGAKEGIQINFKEDGSVIFETQNASIKQDKYGTWTINNSLYGENVQIGGKIPDNELTRLLPKIEFDVSASMGDNNEYTITFKNVTQKQIKDYAEKCKNKGFSIDIEIIEENNLNIPFYTYEAKNQEGYILEVFYMGSSSGLKIKQP